VKEEITREYFKARRAGGRFGVVLVGVAHEKTSAWRGWRDGGWDQHPQFVYASSRCSRTNYYFYILDPEWGPAFIKTVSYAPFSVGCTERERVGQAPGGQTVARVQFAR
jgi:hypothetical protein